jgi:hypothetical protein
MKLILSILLIVALGLGVLCEVSLVLTRLPQAFGG